jgi:hypothetical protein
MIKVKVPKSIYVPGVYVEKSGRGCDNTSIGNDAIEVMLFAT